MKGSFIHSNNAAKRATTQDMSEKEEKKEDNVVEEEVKEENVEDQEEDEESDEGKQISIHKCDRTSNFKN